MTFLAIRMPARSDTADCPIFLIIQNSCIPANGKIHTKAQQPLRPDLSSEKHYAAAAVSHATTERPQPDNRQILSLAPADIGQRENRNGF